MKNMKQATFWLKVMGIAAAVCISVFGAHEIKNFELDVEKVHVKFIKGDEQSRSPATNTTSRTRADANKSFATDTNITPRLRGAAISITNSALATAMAN